MNHGSITAPRRKVLSTRNERPTPNLKSHPTAINDDSRPFSLLPSVNSSPPCALAFLLYIYSPCSLLMIPKYMQSLGGNLEQTYLCRSHKRWNSFGCSPNASIFNTTAKILRDSFSTLRFNQLDSVTSVSEVSLIYAYKMTQFLLTQFGRSNQTP